MEVIIDNLLDSEEILIRDFKISCKIKLILFQKNMEILMEMDLLCVLAQFQWPFIMILIWQ